MTPLDIVLAYIARDWSPVPVKYRGKKAVGTGWTALRITAETAPQYFDGAEQNVGVLLGSASHGLMDVDLDCTEAVELAEIFLPDTHASFGRDSSLRSHLLYQVDGPFNSLTFTDPDCEKDKAMIAELRGDGHQTVFPPSIHESGEPITWDSEGAPAQVTRAELEQGLSRMAAAVLITRRWQSGTQDNLATAVIGCLLRAAWTDDDIETFIRAVAEYSADEELAKRLEKITRLRAAWDMRDHRKVPGLPTLVELIGKRAADRFAKWIAFTAATITSLPAGDTMLHELNEKHALIWVGKELMVMWKGEMDGDMPRLTGIHQACNWYRNRKFGKLNPFDAWVDWPGRESYGQLVFRPGVDDVGRDYNLWAGWPIEPQQGDCSLILEHLYQVICNRDDVLFRYAEDWLANLFQFPGGKPGTAWAMRSGRGAGKGSMLKLMKRMLGRHFKRCVGSEQLTGRFNDILLRALLVGGDEMMWPKDKRGCEKVDSFITEETVPIERKNIPGFEIENPTRFMMATNAEHAAPVALDDRRWVIFYLNEKRIGDYKYWDAINAEIDGGGPAAFLYHLLHEVKITTNLRSIPKTAAHAEQKLLGLRGVAGFWRWALMKKRHAIKVPSSGTDLSMVFGEPLHTTALYEFYLEWCRRNNEHYPDNVDSFGKQTGRLVGGLVKRDMRRVEEANAPLREKDRRAKVYVLPPLADLRTLFESNSGTKPDWADDDNDPDQGEV